MANETSSECSASYVITNIQGCNQETFSCVASNADGDGPRTNLSVTVQGEIDLLQLMTWSLPGHQVPMHSRTTINGITI